MNTSTVVRELQAIREAEADVTPVVGPVPAMDSAAGIYRHALRAVGVDPAAFGTMGSTAWRTAWRMSQRSHRRPGMAQDAKAAKGFNERFPNAVPLRTIG